ncbi:TlpA family protein disulfide reductase [Aquimarina aquimarini]|uniref:TlpA family protein disulfide reductase n=1 Tax=Aquimarina aquimarini TaxID=1191734 RepID=UPI000D55CF08|nr:TlpA disulfide reductase family protein [Aquimarina aquimarini]
MRKLVIALIAIVIIASCTKEVAKDYVTLSGQITNKNSDSILVVNRGFKKVIKVKEDGSFMDTLKVKAGKYTFFDGKEQTTMYLKNGYDVQISLDTKQFDETIAYSGTGANGSNYLAKKALIEEQKLRIPELFDLSISDFDKEADGVINELRELLQATKDLDSTFIANEENGFEEIKKELASSFKQKQFLNNLKGQHSPQFVDYENYNGGTTSLEDLKGKYIYIDLWATWCGPCKAEIPYLKEVEKAYHDKNIEFVSISLDQEKDNQKWRDMIEQKELTGVQLIADNNFKSQFVKDYKVMGIPRFILLDPEGKIVSATAPRPSDEKLKELFNKLNI